MGQHFMYFDFRQQLHQQTVTFCLALFLSKFFFSVTLMATFWLFWRSVPWKQLAKPPEWVSRYPDRWVFLWCICGWEETIMIVKFVRLLSLLSQICLPLSFWIIRKTNFVKGGGIVRKKLKEKRRVGNDLCDYDIGFDNIFYDRFSSKLCLVQRWFAVPFFWGLWGGHGGRRWQRGLVS